MFNAFLEDAFCVCIHPLILKAFLKAKWIECMCAEAPGPHFSEVGGTGLAGDGEEATSTPWEIYKFNFTLSDIKDDDVLKSDFLSFVKCYRIQI